MKRALILIIILVLSGCASSIKINRGVDIKNWNKIAIMPFSGQHDLIANDELTAGLSLNREFDFIIPDFLVGDVMKHSDERSLEDIDGNSLYIIAKKYGADAFVFGSVRTYNESIGHRASVTIKVVDTKTSQVFTMLTNEGSTLSADEESLIKELVNESAQEINLVLTKSPQESSWGF